MAEYLIIYRPPRPTFAEDATEAEQATVGEHFSYLTAALEAGTLILAGRTQDEPPMGIGVFRAESDEAARAFLDGDPAVARGVFKAELRPYRVALLEGRPVG